MMSKIAEICNMALIIHRECGLGLELCATIAEALYNEGCRKVEEPEDDDDRWGDSWD